MITWKYSQMSGNHVVEDMKENHQRPVSLKLVQSVSEQVECIAMEHQFAWHYELPKFNEVVVHISYGRDGTTTAIRGEGYRETMCGTISFYNAAGDRLHTIYTACAPEYGKKAFDSVLDMEIKAVKSAFSDVKCSGIADGAKDNWTYLKAHVDVEILDFYHATEYLAGISELVKKTKEAKQSWLEDACHDLKNKRNGALYLLREINGLDSSTFNEAEGKLWRRTITYFENNLSRMNYYQYPKKGYPIGSGVTEAACKTVIKQRVGQSGMRWNIEAVQGMLSTRALICTEGRWDQFWNNYMK